MRNIEAEYYERTYNRWRLMPGDVELQGLSS